MRVRAGGGGGGRGVGGGSASPPSLLGKQSQSGNIRSTVGQYWLIIKKNGTDSVSFVGNCVNFVGNFVISGKFVEMNEVKHDMNNNQAEVSVINRSRRLITQTEGLSILLILREPIILYLFIGNTSAPYMWVQCVEIRPARLPICRKYFLYSFPRTLNKMFQNILWLFSLIFLLCILKVCPIKCADRAESGAILFLTCFHIFYSYFHSITSKR